VANIKSQKKRVLTNEKRHQRNKAVRSEVKTAIKKVHLAIDAGDAEAAKAAAIEASRLLDKAASKGMLHKNQAANRKSGIMKAANGVGA
jgi:small subunit ribosomal protein S20